METLAELPKGPLDVYRNRTSFNWKSLKVHFEGEDNVRAQAKMWNILRSNPVFQRSKVSLTLNETRRKCNDQVKALMKELPRDFPYHWPLQIFQYDSAASIVYALRNVLIPPVILTSGSERHKEIYQKLQEREFIGALSFTEIAHGSNLKSLQTTATYDPSTEKFIIHTPNFKAAKCWAGMLGMSATHAIVYAQLITPDNIECGLHPFIVPIRDPKTFLPYPGVIAGDMGEKIGLNGVDNGFLIFNQYSIPRINLLNKNADVTKEGKYVINNEEGDEPFVASLDILSRGRVVITSISTNLLANAVVITIRYCAARKQFGPSKNKEWPVIEYQAQHGRIIPFLAAVYAFTAFSTWFQKISNDLTLNLTRGEHPENLRFLRTEVHALSTAAKPLCSWTVQDGLQNCREACGGHGYLKASRLGDLISDNDASCTYEGENNVLIQQASNWLLSQWANVLKGTEIISELGSADFLKDAKHYLSLNFSCFTIEETLEPENLLLTYKWLVCYFLKKTYDRVENLRKKGGSDFTVKNDSQLFFAKTLSLIYAEHSVIQKFIEKIKDPILEDSERRVLSKLCSVYAAWSLEKKLGDIYAGGFAAPDSKFETFLREGIISISKSLVDDAVGLVDVLAPPDFVLNSPLGMADGEIYEHLKETLLKNPSNLERVSWWREIRMSKL